MSPEPDANLEGGELDPNIHAHSSSAFDSFMGTKAPETPKPASVAETTSLDDIEDPGETPVPTPVVTEPAKEEAKEESVPKNLKNPEQIANWKALRAEVKAATEAKLVLEKELTTLKTKGGSSEEVEKLKKERDELADRLAFYDMEKSPGFSSAFDQPIKAAEESVYAALKAAGATEEQLKPHLEKNTAQTLGLDYWDKVVAGLKRNKDTEAHGLRIEASLRTARQLSADRAEALKDPEKRKAFQSKSYEAFMKKAKDDEDFLKGYVAELQSKYDWAKAKEAPANATPEVKAQVAAHNKAFEVYTNIFTQAIESDDVATRSKIGLAAVLSLRLRDQNTALKAQLEEKSKRLEAIESAGSTRRQGGSVAPSTRATPTSARPEPVSIKRGSSREELDDIFNAAVR